MQTINLNHRDDGHYSLPVKVGSIAFTALLDTGCSEVIVSRQVADLLHLDTTKPTERVWLETLTGKIECPAFRLPVLTLGTSHQVHNIRVLVDDRAQGRAYDAILGMSAFEGVKVGLTLETRE